MSTNPYLTSEDYPHISNRCEDHGHLHDLLALDSQLKGDAGRLFVDSEEEISIKVLDIKSGGQSTSVVFNGSEEIEHYLDHSHIASTTRVFLIRQAYSWSRLSVNEKSFRRILAHVEAFPHFIHVIRAFGEKVSDADDSYGDFSFRTDAASAVHEATYLIKYTEEHRRPEAEGNWSVRKMGIYHRKAGTSGDTFIILNPSVSLQYKLKAICERPGPAAPWQVHEAILSCGMENWRWYINEIEGQFFEMKTKAQLTHVDDKGFDTDIRIPGVQFGDTQYIEVLQDRCLVIHRSLEINRIITQGLATKLSALTLKEKPEKAVSSDFLLSLVAKAELEKHRIENILKRLEGTVLLIRTILDFRCLSSLQTNSRMMTGLTRLSKKENTIMVELAQKSSRDTRIVKTLTLLTLVYLPASFVSSMMGMNYITLKSRGIRLFIHFEAEFWIFLVLTFAFLVTTLGSYYWWLRRDKSAGRRVVDIELESRVSA